MVCISIVTSLRQEAHGNNYFIAPMQKGQGKWRPKTAEDPIHLIH